MRTAEDYKIIWDTFGETETQEVKNEIKRFKKVVQKFGNKQASRKGVNPKSLRAMAMFINEMADKFDQLQQCKEIKILAEKS